MGKLVPVPSLETKPAGSRATVFVPRDHSRYASLVEWTKTAEEIWWRFGKSSDGRDGLWVSWSVWQGNPIQGF